MVRAQKAAQIAYRFVELAGGRLNYTKLIKLMYLLDRKLLIEYGYTATKDDYYSTNYGPVLSRVYDFIKNSRSSVVNGSQNTWNEYLKTNHYSVEITLPGNFLGKLNRLEMELIEELHEKFKGYSWQKIVDEVIHDKSVIPECTDADSGSVSIDKKSILISNGISERQAIITCSEDY